MKLLDECYDMVDYLSLHLHFGNRDNDTADFLAGNVRTDDFITGVAAICDAVKAKRHRNRSINLSFDEWNVWYHSEQIDEQLKPWETAPHQLEDVHNFEDSLLVVSILITLLRHADRVKIACMAQLDNVIAPIMTSGSGAWRQTTFYPFMHASRYGKGTVLQTQVVAPRYESRAYGTASILDSVLIWNQESDELTVLAMNKDLNDDLRVTCDLRKFFGYRVAEHLVLTNDDMKATNTQLAPDAVMPTRSTTSDLRNGLFTTTFTKQS